MKKFLLLISLVSLGVSAQDIEGGIKFSINNPTFSDDYDNDAKGKIGYSVGYYETMNLNSHWALQGEIGFTSISYEANDGGEFDEETGVFKKKKSTFSNSFIEVPLIVKYRITESFGIGVGHQFCLDGLSIQDSGQLIDISLDANSVKLSARYYMGSEQLYRGNSLNNISVSVGFTIF
jgi:hypothetical protein